MRHRPLQRAEAAGRRDLLRVLSYDVRLELDPGKDTFRSVSSIHLEAYGAGETFVDLVSTATEVELSRDGQREPVAHHDARISARLDAGHHVLVVSAKLPYSRDGAGVQRFVDPVDGRTNVFGHSALAAAPRWFGCFDQPDLRAVVRLTVDAPKDWRIFGTGRSQCGMHPEVTPAEVATYATGFIAGPYQSFVHERGSARVALHAPASGAATLAPVAADLGDVAGRMIDALHDHLGHSTPWTTGVYHQAFVPGLAWPAVEVAGCTLIRQSLLAPEGTAGYAHLVRVMAHELSHAWFGSVRPFGWWSSFPEHEASAEQLGRTLLERADPSGRFAAEADRRDYGVASLPAPELRGSKPADVSEAVAAADAFSYLSSPRTSRGADTWTGASPVGRSGAPSSLPAWRELRRAVSESTIGPQLALDTATELIVAEEDPVALSVADDWFSDVLLPAGWPDEEGVRQAEKTMAEALRRSMRSATLESAVGRAALFCWIGHADERSLRVLGEALSGRDPDSALAWMITARLCALGGLELRDLTARQVPPDRRAAYRTCLALVPDARTKSDAWEGLLANTEFDPDLAAATARGLWHPLHTAIIGGLTGRYGDEISDRLSGRADHVVAALARLALPRSVDDQAADDSLTRLVGADDMHPAVRRAAAVGRVEIAWRREFRAAQVLEACP
ncbi:M1 family aminopeptidase [Nocardioides sp. LHG3406-4]|uniref:M1 family aminopeptidase n=1 Tax=Nocardioides sp. LHG3406-4 TaxID=2804575 RepID=UPI003CFB1673